MGGAERRSGKPGHLTVPQHPTIHCVNRGEPQPAQACRLKPFQIGRSWIS